MVYFDLYMFSIFYKKSMCDCDHNEKELINNKNTKDCVVYVL